MAPRRERPALPVSESDAERERVAATLRHHYAAGRLSVDEFVSRIDRVYAAETEAELRSTLDGLSASPLATSGGRLGLVLRHEGVLIPAAVFGVTGALLVVIWALTTTGYFWPIWPILGLAFILSLTVVGIYFGMSDREAERIRKRQLKRKVG